MSDYVIDLKGVGKKYTVLKPNHANAKQDFWALKKVTLRINKGEKVGIFGLNGAGKSTLLKIISGITKPSTGTVKTRGRIAALMNLEAGFHPDLTGAENLYFNGMLIGMTRKEVRKKYRQIVKFSGIGEFIHHPFYTYSEGMKFRLAFAVAIASECDILIMDELFAVGDIEFREKVYSQIKTIQQQTGMTTIVSSHVPSFVWNIANVVYELDKGTTRQISKTKIRSTVKSRINKWINVLS